MRIKRVISLLTREEKKTRTCVCGKIRDERNKQTEWLQHNIWVVRTHARVLVYTHVVLKIIFYEIDERNARLPRRCFIYTCVWPTAVMNNDTRHVRYVIYQIYYILYFIIDIIYVHDRVFFFFLFDCCFPDRKRFSIEILFYFFSSVTTYFIISFFYQLLFRDTYRGTKNIHDYYGVPIRAAQKRPTFFQNWSNLDRTWVNFMRVFV